MPAPKPLNEFSKDELLVRVYANSGMLAQALAREAREILNAAIRQKGSARVIFACATSQMAFLASLVERTDLDWSKITVFHMDEYLGLPADHAASFRRFLRERVVDRVHPQTAHYLAGDAPEPIRECDRYSALLQAEPIDLCCLGIGENGHIAFNDPPVADFNDLRWIKIVRLDQASRQQQVGEGFYPNLDSVPQYALSLTIPALCAAEKLLCVVPERRKAQAVRDALQGPIHTACPASYLRRQPQALLALDQDSASLLALESP